MNINSLTKGAAAQVYVKNGDGIFQCDEDGKAPIIEGGFHSATKDPEVIKKRWEEIPNANIGLPMKLNGLVALDVDAYKTEFQDVLPTVPATWTQTSASGGIHYIFKDQGYNFNGQLKLNGVRVEAVDIKHNGYIIGAPSTIGGKLYTAQNFGKPSNPPSWLIEGAAKPETSKASPQINQPLPELQHIKEMLDLLDPNMSYPEWIKILMGVHNGTQGSKEGLKLAMDWSAQSLKFRHGEPERIASYWRKFDPNGGITIKTVKLLSEAVRWGA